MALADTAALVVQLKLDDKLSGPLGRVNASLSRLQAGAGQVGRGVGQIGAGLARVGTIAATGFAVGVGAAVKVAGDFEAQLNTINTIAKLNSSQLTTLGEGIRSTFRETGAPLEELTSAYYDLLSAGIKVSDAQSVLNTAVKLGIGGLATTKESVDLLTTAINAYGLNASQAAQASDIFAAAVRDGKVVISELNASFADVAPLASQVGIKLEEIGAAYATLTARGVPATEVGTQFNRAIIELLKPGPDLVKILDGLGESSFEASLKQKGLVQTLEDVRLEAEKQGIPFQDLFGRLEAYKFALATTGPNQAKFNSELVAMGKAAGETNAQFEERQKGLNFQLAKLKAAVQNAGITIGQALIPKLVPLVEKLSTFVNQNQDKIATFGQKLADGLGAFADRLQTIDFTGVIGGLKLLGEVGKKVVDIFLSLPPGVQGALIAGLAVNKLSGGLLGQGIGNIAGGLLKIAFTRGNTPATPLYTFTVNGGGVGGAPVGGLAGASLLTKVFISGIAIEAGLLLGKAFSAGLVELGVGGIKPAKTYEQGALAGAVNSADVNRIVAGIDSIDDNLKPTLLDVGVSLKDSGAAIALALDIGGVKTQLEKDREVLLDQLTAMGLTYDEAKALVAAQKAATLKYGETAVKQIAAVDALKLPLGLGNVIAGQIRDKGAATLEQTRISAIQAGNIARYTSAQLEPMRLTALQTANAARMTERTLNPLERIAAKPTSFVANITTNVSARLSVTQALYTQTLYNSIKGDNILNLL